MALLLEPGAKQDCFMARLTLVKLILLHRISFTRASLAIEGFSKRGSLHSSTSPSVLRMEVQPHRDSRIETSKCVGLNRISHLLLAVVFIAWKGGGKI